MGQWCAQAASTLVENTGPAPFDRAELGPWFVFTDLPWCVERLLYIQRQAPSHRHLKKSFISSKKQSFCQSLYQLTTEATACCECTCVSTDAFTFGDETKGGYFYLDPRVPCGDDDDQTARPTFYDSRDGDSPALPETHPSSDTEETTSLCGGNSISDGTCDADNNNEGCGASRNSFRMLRLFSKQCRPAGSFDVLSRMLSCAKNTRRRIVASGSRTIFGE